MQMFVIATAARKVLGAHKGEMNEEMQRARDSVEVSRRWEFVTSKRSHGLRGALLQGLKTGGTRNAGERGHATPLISTLTTRQGGLDLPILFLFIFFPTVLTI